MWLVRLFLVKRDAREACAACRSPPAESGDRQHTPHGLVFQGGKGGWLLGSLGVNVGLSGLCREMDELSALRWIAGRKG